MDREDLIERYRSLSVRTRILFAILLGLLPGIYIYFEDGQLLTEELEQVRTEHDAQQSKLDHALAQKKQIPQIEQRLVELEDQLGKARKALPENFRVEEVLQKAASIARETGIKIVLFKPGQEKPGVGEYKYMELPIATELSGKFNQIATFIDRLVHLKQSLLVRNISMNYVPFEDSLANSTQTEHQRALDARQRVAALATVEIVVFRSMTEQEAAMHHQVDELSPEGQNSEKIPDAQKDAEDKSAHLSTEYSEKIASLTKGGSR